MREADLNLGRTEMDAQMGRRWSVGGVGTEIE